MVSRHSVSPNVGSGETNILDSQTHQQMFEVPLSPLNKWEIYRDAIEESCFDFTSSPSTIFTS